MAAGKVFNDNWDEVGTLTGITQDGFRDNANQDTLRFYGNTGYRWNTDNETRVHLNIQENNLELPGSLTLSGLRDDPSQANPGSELVNSQRDFDLYRISAQHATRLGFSGKADFGFSFQHLDFSIHCVLPCCKPIKTTGHSVHVFSGYWEYEMKWSMVACSAGASPTTRSPATLVCRRVRILMVALSPNAASPGHGM